MGITLGYILIFDFESKHMPNKFNSYATPTFVRFQKAGFVLAYTGLFTGHL